jgi:hypothetical protein
MANTLVVGKATVAGTVSGNAPQEFKYDEAGSLGAKLGEFVYLAAGLVTEIGDQPSLILGMITADGNNTTASLYQAPVAIANGDTIFSANKTNYAGTAAATALSDIGKELALYRNTSTNLTSVYLAEGAYAAYGRAICIGFDRRDAVTDIGGRLLFMIKGLNRQLFSTS